MTARGVAGITLEFWRGSGERSECRLRTILDSFASTYCLDEAERAAAWVIALSSVREWEWSL